MSKRIATIKSVSTGHVDWPPRQTHEGSDDVFAEGLGVHRKGDGWPIHCNTSGECHLGKAEKVSRTVFCNGRGVARIGDLISCGDYIATGRKTVYVGD